jgi:DNA-binding transcriptional MerR regulator
MDLMTIGAFAERTRLSPKALRLYDRLGLVVPARTDPASGYRFYSEDQVADAGLVALLRRLGMPLSVIADIADKPPGEAALEAWIREQRREPAGPLRQVLIADQRTATPDTPVCDLSVPLR